MDRQELIELGLADEKPSPEPDVVKEFGGIYFHCPKCDNYDMGTLYSPRAMPWQWFCDKCGWSGTLDELNRVKH